MVRGERCPRQDEAEDKRVLSDRTVARDVACGWQLPGPPCGATVVLHTLESTVGKYCSFFL